MCLCYYKFLFVNLQKGTWCFALVIDFLGENWMPKHIIINLFETLGQGLARSLQNLLKQHGLTKKILVLC